jgi:hypothetical protein
MTTVLVEGDWSTSRLCRFIPGETSTCTLCIRGWMGTKTGLNLTEQSLLPLLGIEPGILGRPADNLIAVINYPGIQEQQ